MEHVDNTKTNFKAETSLNWNPSLYFKNNAEMTCAHTRGTSWADSAAAWIIELGVQMSSGCVYAAGGCARSAKVIWANGSCHMISMPGPRVSQQNVALLWDNSCHSGVMSTLFLKCIYDEGICPLRRCPLLACFDNWAWHTLLWSGSCIYFTIGLFSS